jgi:hypothetical protein
VVVGFSVAGCSLDALYHTTASLGGDTAGQRGNAEVVFINNTPYRAIFTFGAYDELDRNTQPILTQTTIEANSQLDPIEVTCSRVFSVGGEGLNTRVRENLFADDYDEDLLLDGAGFSSAPADSEMANVPNEGLAPPLDALIGVEYLCGSLVIIRFEVNDLGPDPFQITLSAIPADSTRS